MISAGRSLDVIGVPNVADVVQGWVKQINALKVTKSIVDGEVVETTTPTQFTGMIQPYSQQDISLLPEGERAWEWTKIYTQYTDFKLDDEVIIHGETFRIMGKMNYEKYGYGYYRYALVKNVQQRSV